MKKILLLVPSRDRNVALKRMIQSVNQTSTEADVAVYVDQDQIDDYTPEYTLNAKVRVGPQVGPVASINALIECYPGYEIYGACVDDCQFVVKGWDQWALRAAQKFPMKIGMLSPHIPGSWRMDFPWATAGWIKALGWLAYPKCFHYYWDILVEVLAKDSAIVYANPEDCTILHDDALDPNMVDWIDNDAKAVVAWLAFHRDRDTAKIMDAQRKPKEAFASEIATP